LRLARAPLHGPGTASGTLADRLSEVVFRVERRSRRSARRYVSVLAPFLRRLRPSSFGSLCELAPGGGSAGRRSCLSHAARCVRFSFDTEAAGVLKAVRAAIPADEVLAGIRARVGSHLDWKFVHHCDRLLFSVRGPCSREIAPGARHPMQGTRG